MKGRLSLQVHGLGGGISNARYPSGKPYPSRAISIAASGRLLAHALALVCLAGALPAFAQITLPNSLPECPMGGSPCVGFSYAHIENNFILNQFQAREGHPPDPNPVFGPPEYWEIQFSGLGNAYSIKDGTYPGWSVDVNFLNPLQSPGESVLLFNTYVKAPPAPWNNYGPQYAAVNWLLNNKPGSVEVTYATGCNINGTNCTGTTTTTVSDARTIRDVIQQVIWMLFDGGTPLCCTLLYPNLNSHPPTNPQYNASFVFDPTIGNSGGGYDISAAVNALYTQALAHTDYVPSPQGIFGMFMLNSTGFFVEIPPSAPPLKVVKTPKNGTFAPGQQITFTIVVSNPAPAGGASATNVQLTDTLPTTGGLTWTTATPGCTITGGNALSCSLGTIAPQASVTITVSSQSPTPLAACQLQPNTANATADGGVTASDSGSWNCGQLTVVKSPKGGVFNAGDQVSFQFLVRNPAPVGGQSVTNVQLTDTLPTNGGLTWTTVSPGSPICTITGNVLNCSLGTIAPQNSVTVTVSSQSPTPFSACTLQPNGMAGTPVVPGVTVTADGGLTATDWGSQSCSCSQLTLLKTPKFGTFIQGSQVTFTLVVSNPGLCGQTDTNVHLTDVLPTTGGLVWSTTTPGCTISNNTLTCSLGALAPGASSTVVVSSQLQTPLAACDPLQNTASASADFGLTSTDTGSLTCYPPQLYVRKNPKNGTFVLEGQASFQIEVGNSAPAGGTPATNVTLTDLLPTTGGLVWSTTTPGCTITGGNSLNCSWATIPAQGSVTVIVLTQNPTPAAACVHNVNNPLATATASGGLTATDYGSLNCDPPPHQFTCGPFLIRYAANLNVGESYIAIANNGANGASVSGPGLGGATGNICANVYAFDPNEEMISCCSCLVTPNQVQYLRVRQNLVSNIAGAVTPTSVTVKLLSTLAGAGGSGTNCTNSAATVNTGTIVPGMDAWGTTLHATPVPGVYDTTETPFICGSLSDGERASLAARCSGIVGELSGFGICGPCRSLP